MAVEDFISFVGKMETTTQQVFSNDFLVIYNPMILYAFWQDLCFFRTYFQKSTEKLYIVNVTIFDYFKLFDYFRIFPLLFDIWLTESPLKIMKCVLFDQRSSFYLRYLAVFISFFCSFFLSWLLQKESSEDKF